VSVAVQKNYTKYSGFINREHLPFYNYVPSFLQAMEFTWIKRQMNIRFGSYRMRGRTTMCNKSMITEKMRVCILPSTTRWLKKITVCIAVIYLICCHAYSKT